MANFNPQERDSLMSLLSALNGGLSGSQGYSALGNILSQQQTRIDNRQARMGSLIDMLVNNAGSGGSLEASRALARAYTNGSNIPPQIRQTLQDLYPQESGPESMSYGLPQGPGDPSQSFSMPAPQPGPAQNFSPLAPGPAAMTPQDQLATMQVMENQASMAQAPQVGSALATQWASFLGQEKPDGSGMWTAEEIMADFVQSDAFAALDVYGKQAAMDALQQALTAAPQEAAPVAGGPGAFAVNPSAPPNAASARVGRMPLGAR